MDRFWETTTLVAQLCARLTKEFRGVPADLAYTFGLFHDCGIAVLMRRFPDYRETLQIANNAENESFTAIEDKRHATNHAVLGYLLTRNWGLSEDLCNAILLHHDIDVFAPVADATAAKARTLVSLSALAEYYVNSCQRLAEDAAWQRMRAPVMAHLGISDYRATIEVIRRDNPLPLTCGLVSVWNYTILSKFDVFQIGIYIYKRKYIIIWY